MSRKDEIEFLARLVGHVDEVLLAARRDDEALDAGAVRSQHLFLDSPHRQHQAALSYLRSKADSLGIAGNFLEKTDIHIHFPAGSIPKDGPSAGVTILTALVSLLTGIRVRSDVAMTGEVTLRGLVLPVGGIKEKVLAAHRAGIKRIIIPARNEKDLIDVPEQARKELDFVFAAHMDEVLAAALEENPIGRTPPAPSTDGEGEKKATKKPEEVRV